MHDKNGKPLKEGDKVLIEADITTCHATEEFCNITLAIGKDLPHGAFNIQTTVTLNAKQVELLETPLEGKSVEVEFLTQFFAYDHLPPHLQAISKPFGELAKFICTLPRNPERTVALRKLLEAKDCAVRANLAK